MAVSAQRTRMRNHIIECCAKHSRWATVDRETQEAISRRVERSCVEETINSCIRDGIDHTFADKKFLERYSANCYRILANLDMTGPVGSEYLLDSIIDKKVDPCKVAAMTSADLCPGANKDLRDQIELRLQQKFRGKVSHAYRCHKCGKNETVFVEYQARCADEASTSSIKCINCEAVWRH